MALESLLGRALSDREAVSVRAFEPPPLSGEQRQEILAGLDAYFARIDAQRMSVSPGSSFLRQRCRAGRLVVAPDKPSSLKMVLHPAFFRPRVAGQGSGRPSRRGHGRISCSQFCTDICNVPSPLFTVLPAMMQNLPFVKHGG